MHRYKLRWRTGVTRTATWRRWRHRRLHTVHVVHSRMPRGFPTVAPVVHGRPSVRSSEALRLRRLRRGEQVPVSAPTLENVVAVDQIVRYAHVGGRTVAWSEVGSGPALIIGGWWCSHVQADWQDERFRHFVRTLARNHRVIRYDRPGSGLSGRDGETPGTRHEEVAVLLGSPRPSDSTRSRCSARARVRWWPRRRRPPPQAGSKGS